MPVDGQEACEEESKQVETFTKASAVLRKSAMD
jgi:hypothetical protein